MSYDARMVEKLVAALESYLATTPAFADDRRDKERAGFTVSDRIDIGARDAAGKPTALLIRSYYGAGKAPGSHPAAFEFTQVRDGWQIRCSSGYPGSYPD